MPLVWIALGLAVWETFWWDVRRSRRMETYAKALSHARAIQRPLVVIGAPDGGATAGYGCGDITVDLAKSSCPNSMQLDVTKKMPFATDSVCCLIVCTLECVKNLESALAEIGRISGGHAFFVGVEPWTLTALFHPDVRQTLPARYR